MERWIVPLGRLSMRPPEPKAMSDAASSSASMVITASPSHAPATSAASCAPSLTSELPFPGLRLNTLTSCPALTRLAAIAAPMRPSPINPSFIRYSVYVGQLDALQRCHELRTDRIGDRRVHDTLDQIPLLAIERPARNTKRCLHLIGVTAAPERDADTLFEHPTHRQMDHAPVEAAPCELIELLHGLEILGKTGRLEFRVDAPQIVAVEGGVRTHAPAQQSSTECAIAERRDVVGTTVRQDVHLNGAFEKVVGRLQHVQWGHLAEALHLGNREVAHADGADFPLPVKRAHGLGGFLHRHQRVGPMDLVDVDVVGTQAAQRIIDFLHDSGARRIAIDFSVAPFQSCFGGNDRLTAHARESGADDLLGHAKAVHRRRIDQIDALMQSRVNGGNRFALISSSPHPAAPITYETARRAREMAAPTAVPPGRCD